MEKITIQEIVDATGGHLIYGNPMCQINAVSTDSRKAKKGDIFFPIIGETHDAHKFIPQVLENGCDTIIVSAEVEAQNIKECNVIKVSNTTKALQDLAKYYLEKLNLKKIAVTGSVGKTSTRDMVYYVCSQKYKTGKTEGNFNNDIGVPLTIFSFDSSMDVAVLEIGMDHAEEIHRMVDLVRPDIGIITNVGISHIENLGSRENILAAKMEITDFFTDHNCLIVNQASDLLSETNTAGNYKLVTVGDTNGSQYTVDNVIDMGEEGIEYDLINQGKRRHIRLNIPGGHNSINATLAIAAGREIGITIEEAIVGLSELQLTGKRLTVHEGNGIKVIDDTYNACPESMKSAINTLENTKGTRKIAILGGMNELGPDSEEFHKTVGRYAKTRKIDILITIGDKAKAIAEGAKGGQIKVIHFDTKEDFYKSMDEVLKKGDIVIVKASRTFELEDIVNRIVVE